MTAPIIVGSGAYVSGGVYVVSSGTSGATSLTSTTIASGTIVSVIAGGFISNTSATSTTGIVYSVYAGGSASNITIGLGAGGEFTVNGGTETSTTDFAQYTLSATGGSAISSLVSSGGIELVDTGATATSTTVFSSGIQKVNGGTAIGTVVNSGGILSASNSGTVTSASILGGGTLLLSGTKLITATGVTVANGGSVGVGRGGTLTSAAILAGGIVTLSPYTTSPTETGSAYYTTVYGGGVLIVSAGASATSTVSSAGAMVVNSVVSSGATLTAAPLVLSSGGYTLAETVSSGGTLTVGAGAAALETTISAGGTQSVTSGGGVLSTNVASSGTETVASGGYAYFTTVTNGGNQNVSGGNASFTMITSGGSVTVSSGGTATSNTILNGGTETIGVGGNDVGNIISSGGTEVVSQGGTISGTDVIQGGTLDLLGYNAASTTASISAGDLLTVSSGGVTSTYQLTGTYTTGPVSISSDGGTGIDLFTCYMAGTQIRTAQGEVAIETIRAGQDVVVRRNGQDVLEPVRWIGTSRIELGGHAHPELAAPIRVKAGALADNTPVRDLLLSPEHCLILQGRCVPVKLLVNGGSIAREFPTAAFNYYHLELEQHGILIADGAEAESYLDTGNRILFDNAGQPRTLHKAFEVNSMSDRWNTDACAPLASVETEVGLIWQALADRSATLGMAIAAPALVAGADLHIMADGQRIEPVSDRDPRFVFMIPAGVQSVSLASRFCIPADKMVSTLRDTRRLGVSVNWIAIRAGESETILSADHPSLQNGWNDAERDGATMWRWTNGAATIPWAGIEGAAVLTVRCTPVDQYPIYDQALALVA